jgi:hypothetical protein
LRDQPATLVCRHLIFLDRALDGGLFVGRVVDDADKLRGRALDMVNGPGAGLLLGIPQVAPETAPSNKLAVRHRLEDKRYDTFFLFGAR